MGYCKRVYGKDTCAFIQYDGNNFPDILRFVGSNSKRVKIIFETSFHNVVIETDRYTVSLRRGEFLVLDTHGNTYAYSGQEFKKEFLEVERSEWSLTHD